MYWIVLRSTTMRLEFVAVVLTSQYALQQRETETRKLYIEQRIRVAHSDSNVCLRERTNGKYIYFSHYVTRTHTRTIEVVTNGNYALMRWFIPFTNS